MDYKQQRFIHLRVKVKNLAAEAVIIRQEANKVSGEAKAGLKDHNRDVVRPHARSNLLAYGLLKGTPYKLMEQKCEAIPNFVGIRGIAERFGGDNDEIDKWIEEAKEYLKTYKKNFYW